MVPEEEEYVMAAGCRSRQQATGMAAKQDPRGQLLTTRMKQR